MLETNVVVRLEVVGDVRGRSIISLESRRGGTETSELANLANWLATVRALDLERDLETAEEAVRGGSGLISYMVVPQIEPDSPTELDSDTARDAVSREILRTDVAGLGAGVSKHDIGQVAANDERVRGEIDVDVETLRGGTQRSVVTAPELQARERTASQLLQHSSNKDDELTSRPLEMVTARGSAGEGKKEAAREGWVIMGPC